LGSRPRLTSSEGRGEQAAIQRLHGHAFGVVEPGLAIAWEIPALRSAVKLKSLHTGCERSNGNDHLAVLSVTSKLF
jgi:hypothetical protein